MATNNKNIREKLMKIQVELKAPKNLYNSFGKYKYRNAEGIQEAVKPFLDKHGVYLTLSDDVIEISGHTYVKAYARITDCESGEYIESTGYARESDDKKGMDSAQITGSTSSYARKYALNGLLLLDDTKDVDSEEYQAEAKKSTAKVQAKTSRQLLKEFCLTNKIDPKPIIQACNLKNDSPEEEWAKALEYAKTEFAKANIGFGGQV